MSRRRTSPFRKIASHRARRVATGQPHTRRLRFEPLEQRPLLALLTVNSLADGPVDLTDSVVTLRDAIEAANNDLQVSPGGPTGSGADEITFQGGLAGTITLNLGQLGLSSDLTIVGPGANVLTVAGESDSHLFSVNDAGDETSKMVVIGGLNISGGAAVRGIFNAETLTVKNCTVSGHTPSDGGGIFNHAFGTLTVLNTVISGSVAGNRGGGIFSEGDMTLTQSTVSGNSATGNGGGIYARRNVTLTQSTISDNTARGGGGLSLVNANVTIEDSTISGNSANEGGGIFASGDVTLTQSTVSGNSGSAGGGIYAYGDVTLTQSTVSGNSSTNYGGGIFARRNVTLTQSTVSGNSAKLGGGVFMRFYVASIYGSIVAGNTGLDFRGLEAVFDVHNSLIGFSLGTSLAETPIGAPDADGNLIGGPVHGVIDPRLGPLADNGGLTHTHALLAGSPAIDAGDPNIAVDPAQFDQRGAPFVRVFDGDGTGDARIDMGAYERQTLSDLSLVVGTLVDESDGDNSAGNLSLREAIGLANGSIGADTITFAESLTSAGPTTIGLTQAQLEITDDLSITGPGASLLTIDQRTPGSLIFSVDDGRIFSVDDGDSGALIDVEIAGLTLTGGQLSGANNGGGAIRSRENLTLTACTVIGNESIHSGGGGILQSGGSLTLSDCTISDNTGRSGGGLSLVNANVTIEDSTISGNRATELTGGGIALSLSSTSITGSTISGNTAGTFGGGIYLSSFSPSLIVKHSTITGNRSDASGSPYSGGGIAMALFSYGVTLDHVIVAGNVRGAGAVPDDVRVDPTGGRVFASYSLIGDKTGTSLAEAPIGAPDADGNLIGGPVHGVIDPLLGPLAGNGGLTHTHALLAGSPAMDAGNPAAVAGMGDVPEFDQRGAPFSRSFDGVGSGSARIDIGAFEFIPQDAVPTLFGDYSHNGAVDAADYIVWRKSQGQTITPFTGADSDGDGMIDQDDYRVWRTHFGQTVPVIGLGDSVAAVSVATAGQSSLVEPVMLTKQVTVPVALEQRASVGLPPSSERDIVLALLDQPLPRYGTGGQANPRRLHVLVTTAHRTRAHQNDLLLTRTAAAGGDRHAFEHGQNPSAAAGPTKEAVETRSEALDIAFTTLERSPWPSCDH